MDAEDFYESRRLKDDEMEDKREERKVAHELAFFAKEIREIFGLAFAIGGSTGRKALRLPRVVSTRDGDAIRYMMSVPEAIADAVSYDGDPMFMLMEACQAETPDLTAFKEECIQAYLKDHLDDLAECAVENWEEDDGA